MSAIMVLLFYPTDIIEGNFFKLFVILLFMFYLPSFRFSLRLRVLWLLNMRSLLLSLRLLNFLLGLLFWLLNLRLSLLLTFRFLNLGLSLLLLSLLLLSLLLLSLNLRPLLILLLPFMSYFLSLLLGSRLIALDTPSSLSFPMSIFMPPAPVLLKPLVRNSFIIPAVPVPILVSVVSSPTRVYIKIKIWDTVIITPTPVIIM